MTVLTLENATEYYRTENEFSTIFETLTDEDKSYIKDRYRLYHKVEGYEKDAVLCFLASDLDCYVTFVKKILKEG